MMGLEAKQTTLAQQLTGHRLAQALSLAPVQYLLCLIKVNANSFVNRLSL